MPKILVNDVASLFFFEGRRIDPGNNYMGDAEFERFAAHPSNKRRFDAGVFKVRDVNNAEPAKEEGEKAKTVTAPASTEVPQFRTVDEAADFIRGTYNVSLLKRIAANDTRKGVQKAVKQQIDEIDAAGKADSLEDDEE